MDTPQCIAARWRGTLRTLAAWLVIFAAALIASRAHADQPNDSAQAQDAKEATEAGNLGKKLAREGEIERALYYFKRAYDLRQTYITAANLGTAELKTERYRDAAQHLSEALRHLPANQEDARPQLEQSLKAAQEHVLTLAIEVEPAGALVFVDTEQVGVAPLPGPIFLDAGPHVAYAATIGRRSQPQTVLGAPGKQHGIRILVDGSGSEPPDVGPANNEAAPPAPTDSVGLTTQESLLIGGGVLAGTTLVFSLIAIGVTAGYSDDIIDLNAQLDQIDPSLGACVQPSAAAAPLCRQISNARTAGITWQSVAIGTGIGTGVVGLGMIAVWLFFPEPEPTLATPPSANLSIDSNGFTVQLRGEF